MPGDTLTSDIDRFKEAALSCPIPAAVELIGEKWAFLILRGAFNDLHHFEEFQAGLGIARNILSDRLGKLVAGGILERSADPSDKRKVIYSLTPKGEACCPLCWRCASGARTGAMEDPASCLRTAGTESPCRRCASTPTTGENSSLRDLIWIDREECRRRRSRPPPNKPIPSPRT